jgi:hypothetical protein|tara:strand:- start:12152 stop:12466 length:315 start_codon:yes stop_codon:yes gene_type:complete
LTSKRRYPGAKEIIKRLREGQKILDKQHQAWVDQVPDAWKSAMFADALALFHNMERLLRECTDFTGCIWNSKIPKCDLESVAMCERCLNGTTELEYKQDRMDGF